MDANFWTYFWVLLAGGLFSTMAVIPYSLAINPEAVEKAKAGLAAKGGRIPPMLIILLASLVQSVVLIAVATYFGLRASLSVGLRLPILQAIATGQPWIPVLSSGLGAALLVGFVAGTVIIGLELGFFKPRLPEALQKLSSKIPLWKRALACFYGGIFEEVLLRLFVMGGLIWLIGRLLPFSGTPIAPTLFWIANLLATLLFGLGHLPATVRITPLTPIVITRALVLNGLAGLLFGVLFWKFGLEFAMLAHFCADVLLHIILPEFTSRNQEAQPAKAE